MDQDKDGFFPREGMTIVGSDGETVGEIDVVERSYVIVRRGGIFPQDYYIPRRDITGRDEDGTLRLAIPADQALERGLGNPMAAIGADDLATPPPAESPVPETDAVEPAAEEIPHAEPPYDAGEMVDLDAPDSAFPVDDEAHRTVTLAQEEVSASTRPVERGRIRVEKKVIEEKQTIEVPLVEDEVHVTRRAVDREITADDAAFEERTIEVPLRGQGVEIEKRAQVVEEVEIAKTAHQRIETVHETIRHETAGITGENIEEIPPVADADEDEPSRED